MKHLDLFKTQFRNFHLEGWSTFREVLTAWNASRAENIEGIFVVTGGFNVPYNVYCI